MLNDLTPRSGVTEKNGPSASTHRWIVTARRGVYLSGTVRVQE